MTELSSPFPAAVAICRHCKKPIRNDSTTWWHDDTGSSQCAILADPLPGTITTENEHDGSAVRQGTT